MVRLHASTRKWPKHQLTWCFVNLRLKSVVQQFPPVEAIVKRMSHEIAENGAADLRASDFAAVTSFRNRVISRAPMLANWA